MATSETNGDCHAQLHEASRRCYETILYGMVSAHSISSMMFSRIFSYKGLQDYHSLHKWSIEYPSDFWRFTFQYFTIVYSGTVPDPVVDEHARMDTVPKWFPGIKLNFAENILFTGNSVGQPSSSPGKEDDKVACTQVREEGYSPEQPILHVTWAELRERVGRLTQAMKAHDVGKGDRVAVVGSVCVDTLTVFLAVTALGGIFSSNSTDLGVSAVLDRLTQIQPKLVFADDYAVYRGSRTDLRPKIAELVAGLEDIPGFQGIIAQARFRGSPTDVSSIPMCQTWETFTSKARTSELEFEKMDFSDPMIILYSSGTTGQAKCIVHSVGGIVLSGHKESTLHRAVDHTSSQLQFTTTSWMMYLSSVQLMLTGARLVMYDGHPFTPDTTTLLRLVAREKITHFGISPRYLQTLQSNGVVPRASFDLSHLQVVTSTGMILSDALFQWFYDVGFPSRVLLANISGGTDIVAAFGTCNPLLPLYVGGCQCISLGMAVSVFDPTVEGDKPIRGRPIPLGQAGELVCTQQFPTMPVRFWGDDDGSRYFDSYFKKYDNCWTHGDFISIHPRTKQVTMLGRADGVLNPSGIRFGSAEIYNVIDTEFADCIADSVCVGQRRPQDDDERVMLFLLMQPGRKFTAELVQRVKQHIRARLSARHVPRFIFQTPEIPMTLNAKKVELPIKHIVSSRAIKPSSSLANPACLDFYYDFARDEVLAGETGSDKRAKL
ncbi:uncharacterized protein TRUGW13939_10301 [Talaromyces rugulosus]|uniref:AMP-dependent synthetase/ligase domain-containing protein n=1 Tax=Talaromyces rugulosus TaxID=121627 RepID=A0A7H8RF14_TALRU|nr:uncharacterized protein TRUGW13939_10301 [Talaromyces rugulosus]QKX63133.1 hypothetical protein TRUGW13939_10301 [Talaromyces rugulosus]